MQPIIQINGAEIVIELMHFFFVALGWFSKGLLFAIGGELIFKPIARKFKKELKKWQKNHPVKTTAFIHHFYNHQEDLKDCPLCNSQSLATSPANRTVES